MDKPVPSNQTYAELSKFVRDECKKRLRAYEAQPRDAAEHYETENEVLSGGYAYRQLFEMVQNAADAILESGEENGRIHVTLDPDRLEAANTGAPLDEDGIVALLNARSSSKRGNQIGRFGIGFKSLLKLGGRVDLVSRSIGLRFDPSNCRGQIRSHLGLHPDAPAPGMRLAETLDPADSKSPLSMNGEFEWATTLVSAEIKDGTAFERISNEIENFPAEFLLFLPANIELVMEVSGGVTRRIIKTLEGSTLSVSDGHTETKWMVFERSVEIESPEAREDATHIQRRDRIPLAWAVPVGGRDQAGRFWAFFPTETHSLTSGILNAPWKLNSDRTNLIRGPWNEAIMEAAADLMADSLPDLATQDDFGTPISAFPRQPDRQDEIAVPLVKKLWERILPSKVLPSVDGIMRSPSEVRHHFIVDSEICGDWGKLADPQDQRSFLHPDCYKYKARISRLKALKSEAARDEQTVLPDVEVSDWLECISTPEPAHAKQVLSFVGKILENRYKYQIYSSADAKIIPDETGELVTPKTAVINHGLSAPAGYSAVHPEIAEDPVCRKILVDLLNVKELSENAWEELLEASLVTAELSDEPRDWHNFWENIAAAPLDGGGNFLAEVDNERLKLRTVEGGWERRNKLVAPRPRWDVPGELAIDLDFFNELGINLPETMLLEFPVGTENLSTKAEGMGGYGGYLNWVGPAFDRVCRERVNRTPQYHPGFKGRSVRFPAGWELLPGLPPAARALLTQSLVESVYCGSPSAHPVTLVHPTREKDYPKLTAPNPFWFWVAEHGRFKVGNIVLPIKALHSELGRRLVDAEVPGYETLDSFLRLRDEESDLGSLLEWEQPSLKHKVVGKFWAALFDVIQGRGSDFAKLQPIWELAYSQGEIPPNVPTCDGPVPLGEIFVVSDQTVGHDLDDGKIVLLSAEARTGWIKAGAQPLDSNSLLSFRHRVSDPSHLLDVFPGLAASKELSQKVARLSVVWVDGLSEALGPRVSKVSVAMDPDGAILLDKSELDNLKWPEVVRLLLECLSRHGLVPPGEPIEELLFRILDQRPAEARDRVRKHATHPMRLLEAVGGEVQNLLSILEASTRKAIVPNTNPIEVAELVLAVHGPTVLSKLRTVLEFQGLAPPARWGGEAAREFVKDLGFPSEFAATAGSRREAEISVSGPISLPELHGFQKEILENVSGLLSSGKGRRRAVISLPTGGGKTRVAAEAVVKLVLKGGGRRSVLWIAQTDELCEQAVQCFRQLWVNVGEPGENLRIIRFWGGQRNPPPSDTDEAVVFVASIQTLNSRSSRSELDWMTKAGVIIVDECHHAITSSYTNLMRWLDMQVGSERSRELEAPMIGLSATPWRGYNDEESERLASRFDRRWFPNDQGGLHKKLSSMGVLADRSYRPLRYDRSVALSEREQQHVDTFGELPDSVIERIGADRERNDLIVQAVLKSSAESVLLFANSVAHAQYLAARLHMEGCPSAAVSGQTDRLARQHFTRRFRSGELRVICNHSVLTTGFDAPKADMILISRPVFSPVLYMQMVGRGLRGPANGGTEHCEIMTVEDNIMSFQDRMAYHFCRRFFDS